MSFLFSTIKILLLMFSIYEIGGFGRRCLYIHGEFFLILGKM